MTLRECRTCKQQKTEIEFHKCHNVKGGIRWECKECRQQWRKSKVGRITLMYEKQKGNSKYRMHPMPTYSKEEFINWCLSQSLFHKLYEIWANNDFHINLTPTCDRIKDSEPYTFSNIQLMSWENNKKKGEIERKKGISITNQMRTVLQLSAKRQRVIAEYASVALAARAVGSCTSNICACCNGLRHSAAGYIWKYK